MRCLRGHQRHGAFSCRWLRAAVLLCNSLRVKHCQQRGGKKRNTAASARMFAARRLRAAVVACGAVGAGAARGAATKAVKSAPGTIYRRGSCHPRSRLLHCTWAVACTEAPAAAKEHSTGQEERAGHPQSVCASLGSERFLIGLDPSERKTPQRNGIPEPLSSPSPSAAASLEMLRAEVGARRREKR